MTRSTFFNKGRIYLHRSSLCPRFHRVLDQMNSLIEKVSVYLESLLTIVNGTGRSDCVTTRPRP
jgi:hypothetical protein